MASKNLTKIIFYFYFGSLVWIGASGMMFLIGVLLIVNL
ncbi:hypothetical protein C823_003216 [Eubacterium plexicaudatum ASF492]|uniref:Uncharacterized protein n=1 Tax=Eubacterium plexicaudatum ASF492 TaxID=1235802 RepID=N2ANB6_9FIRM|nr:hypothetical protein C823_003216 [Eubacterium plexicaudatum ASF492]